MAKKGFFDLSDTLGLIKQNTPVVTKTKSDINDCSTCGLYKTCKSPKMEVHGEGNRKILLLGENGGVDEDDLGEQLVGATGKLLIKKFAQYGIDMNDSCWKFNSCSCRSFDEKNQNRKPTSKEIACCRPRVLETIFKLQPKYIILLGECAVESLFGDRFDKEKLAISSWRKRCIPDQTFNAFILPLYHPAFLLHNKDEMVEKIWDLDFKFVISCLNKEFPEYKEPIFHNLLDYRDTIKELKYVKNNIKLLCYDYETTGLHPQQEGQKVVSVATTYDKSNSYSFPLYHKNNLWTKGELEEVINCWKDILVDSEIKKTNHNIKFEEQFNRHFFKVRDDGWISDTMQLGHLLDEMRGGKGGNTLELQSYFHLGIKEYKDATEYYKKDSGNGFNRMDECPLDILLLYGNRDSYYTFCINDIQQKELARKKDIQEAYSIAFNGILAFMDTEEFGLRIDVDYYKNQEIELTKEINKIQKELLNSEEAKKFELKFNKKVDLNSNKDLQALFFDILNLKASRQTKTGSSVDEESLNKLKNSFADNLLKARKIKKIRDTYLAQFLRHYNGRLYPNFHQLTGSGRSGAYNPNMQNIPVKDEGANRICRTGIIPEEGFGLMDFDYSGAEVRAMACNSKDDALIKYILDPSTDMHRDVATDIFITVPEEITKDVRYCAKSNTVFAWFYGDVAQHSAKLIWEEILGGKLKLKSGIGIKKHLESKGIKTLTDFTNHMEDVEKRFWNRILVTDNWRRNVVREYYIEHGYISTLAGYRRGGFLNKKQLMNTPVQGGAFSWLLWSYARVNEIRKKEGWKSRLIGQIHDCLVWNYYPDEKDHLIRTVCRVMTKDIREHFSHIIVPLDVEIELTKVNGSWYSKKEMGKEELERILHE